MPAVLLHGGVERNRESLEDAAKHLDRPGEDILVSHLDPLARVDVVARRERQPVGGDPLECADFLERRAVVIAPAGRQEEVPFPEFTLIDGDGLRCGAEKTLQAEAAIGAAESPAIDHRAYVVAPVAMDEHEVGAGEQLVQVANAQRVDARLLEHLPTTEALVKEAQSSVPMMRLRMLRSRRLRFPGVVARTVEVVPEGRNLVAEREITARG